MSDTTDRPEAASDKRRAQARERQRKRAELNLHYIEEEAIRALENGALKDLSIDFTFPARFLLTEIADWLGIDRTAAINQSIHFAARLVLDNRTTISHLEHLVNQYTQGIHDSLIENINFIPTRSSIQSIIRANHRDAGMIYANSGVILLFESLHKTSVSLEETIKAESWKKR